jgi:hypothetical protein
VAAPMIVNILMFIAGACAIPVLIAGIACLVVHLDNFER